MTTRKRIYLLDAWRGIAASVVFFHHLFINFKQPFVALKSFSAPLYRSAEFVSDLNASAVLLFFVVSGFSIHLSACDLNMARAEDINVYIYKRLRRLLPLYFLALIFTLFVGIAGDRLSPSYSFKMLLGNLLFLQSPGVDRGNWFVPYGDNYPLWSLSFEMFFYACYPFLCRYLRHKNAAQSDYLFTGSVIAIAWSAIGFVFYNVLPNPLALFASHFVIWYAGVLLAELYLKRITVVRSLSVLALMVISIGLLTFAVHSAILTILRTGLVIALVWAALLSLPNVLKKKIDAFSRPVVFLFAPLGFCSYATYLFHQPLIHFFKAIEIDQNISLIVLPLVCIAIAAVAEYVVALPKCLWLKRCYIRS